MSTYSTSQDVVTEIGLVKATASIGAADLSQNQISFQAINFEPRLPAGMSVKKCTLLLLVVKGSVELETLDLELSLRSKALGYPCTGQCLDAQEWRENGNLVVIGTEDGEALSYRFPRLGLEDKVVVESSERSMTLRLRNLGKLDRPSFHFIVAENDYPEPVDSSAWFAVDQAHGFLLGL